MKLSTAVYTAQKGYAWSNPVDGVPPATLNRFCRYISAARGDFPDPLSVEIGIVSDGQTVAAFTIQNVDRWDSEQRASDYTAFAFFTTEQAAEIDFIELLNNDFFWTPTHTPQTSIDYTGAPSMIFQPGSVRDLVTNHVCLLKNPRTIGSFFARYGAESSRWIGFLKAENILKIECDDWK